MHFEYMELEAPGADLIGGRKISSLLAEKGYKSLYAECAEVVTRYVLGLNGSTDPPGSASDTRTVDVLIPPTDPSARIVIGERPSPGAAGVVVAVIAVGRSPEDAHRSRIAVKMVLDKTAVGGEETFATYIVNDNGRASERRFRQEWVRAFGLVRDEGYGPDSSSSLRQATKVQVLLALQETPPVLGRPGLMRSRIDKEEKSRIPDPAILDGLVAEGLVEKAHILVCRQTGQVVGVGKDVSEVRAAMRLSLRCPHCQSPLGEEIQDVLYSLTELGDEFLRSTSLILGALDAALRKNGCGEVVLGDGLPEQLVDAAACYQDAVLLFRVSEAAPRRADVQALQRTMKEFMATESEVTVLGAYVAAGSDPETAAAANDPHAPCMVLEISDLETGVDRLLEDIRRANFTRLTGSTVVLPQPDPVRLLSPDHPAGDR
ncbi:MAG TPA: hypothetical protein VFW01_07800 [bacterium]|nr:hypothetical protein [bacterium]